MNQAKMVGWVVTSVPAAGGTCTWYSSAQARSINVYSAVAVNSCAVGFVYNTSFLQCSQTVTTCPIGMTGDPVTQICSDPCSNTPDITAIVAANYSMPAGYLSQAPFPSQTYQATCGTMYMKSPDAILCDGVSKCLVTYGAGSKGAAAAIAASPSTPATCTALGLGYATSELKTVCVGGGAVNPSAPAPVSGVAAASPATTTTASTTRTVTSTDPLTGVTTSSTFTTAPTGSGGTGTAPTNQTPSDLCISNPTASACADLGTAPATDPLPTGTIDVSGTNFSSLSFSGSATCPAPKVYSIQGVSHSYSYQPFCDFLSAFKLIALAVAFFIGAMIMLGQKSSDTGG
ncbi:MAG: virulence factor TspB C-terminal domain-related protein [Gallionellaceae bacterium]|nr:virulence factor TspB C-terminal domain-related protein [Gallionellaceae bacterium]